MIWTARGYKYYDWNYMFEDSKANTELSFVDKIVIARNLLRYEKLLDKI